MDRTRDVSLPSLKFLSTRSFWRESSASSDNVSFQRSANVCIRDQVERKEIEDYTVAGQLNSCVALVWAQSSLSIVDCEPEHNFTGSLRLFHFENWKYDPPRRDLALQKLLTPSNLHFQRVPETFSVCQESVKSWKGLLRTLALNANCTLLWIESLEISCLIFFVHRKMFYIIISRRCFVTETVQSSRVTPCIIILSLRATKHK